MNELSVTLQTLSQGIMFVETAFLLSNRLQLAG
jgi:hypothetical protein